jgi:hypothetical protein
MLNAHNGTIERAQRPFGLRAYPSACALIIKEMSRDA